MKRKVHVVGAGPGGLAAALSLLAKGYKVEVFEKDSVVGGRNKRFELDEYKFDQGPTFLSMIHLLEELFADAGKNLHDYVDLRPLEDMYELIFTHNTLQMSSDKETMRRRIAEIFPGNEQGYDRFLVEQRHRLEKLTPVLRTRMDRPYHYVSKRVLKALPSLAINRSLYDVLSTYFQHEDLKLAFTFQSKYLGMSPWKCPGAFSILSFMEHEFGVYYPIGGVSAISQAMAKAVEELGGVIHTDSPVERIIVRNGRAYGIALKDGRLEYSDDVVVNADFGYMATKLLKDVPLKKYNQQKLDKKKFSCSTFMLYIGVNKEYDSAHHTILFADDYRKNVEEIAHTFELSEDPSIYIQNAAVTDSTVAPKGKSALYILVPVPNNRSDIKWNDIKHDFREKVLDIVEQKTPFKDIREHIEVEKIYTPYDWEYEMNVFEGATFNLSHHLTQMMYLRPHNEFEEVKHLYLVGGGTHPGSGLPTIFESAKISSSLLDAQYDKGGNLA